MAKRQHDLTGTNIFFEKRKIVLNPRFLQCHQGLSFNFVLFLKLTIAFTNKLLIDSVQKYT